MTVTHVSAVNQHAEAKGLHQFRSRRRSRQFSRAPFRPPPENLVDDRTNHRKDDQDQRECIDSRRDSGTNFGADINR